jgi:nucleotidyltransferase substrate binding protein (TIGR01987 family)
MTSLSNALNRLEEALKAPLDNDLVLDATIQRFEFSLDLFWKTLKRLLSYGGVEAKFPREVLKQAYQIGWLQDEEAWLQMLDDRNQMAHIYDEAKAREIYGHIHRNFPEMRRTFEFLKAKFADILTEESQPLQE